MKETRKEEWVKEKKLKIRDYKDNQTESFDNRTVIIKNIPNSFTE